MYTITDITTNTVLHRTKDLAVAKSFARSAEEVRAIVAAPTANVASPWGVTITGPSGLPIRYPHHTV